MASIAQLGDPIVLIISRNGKVKKLFTQRKCLEDINGYQLAKKMAEEKNIELRKALQNQKVAKILVLGRHKENLPDGSGYGSLNGKATAKLYVSEETQPLSELSHILLLTDGMVPPMKSFFGHPDWSKVANGILDLGLKRFYEERVFKPKESDSQLIKFPRLKTHDDASCIIISIN